MNEEIFKRKKKIFFFVYRVLAIFFSRSTRVIVAISHAIRLCILNKPTSAIHYFIGCSRNGREYATTAVVKAEIVISKPQFSPSVKTNLTLDEGLWPRKSRGGVGTYIQQIFIVGGIIFDHRDKSQLVASRSLRCTRLASVAKVE